MRANKSCSFIFPLWSSELLTNPYLTDPNSQDIPIQNAQAEINSFIGIIDSAPRSPLKEQK